MFHRSFLLSASLLGSSAAWAAGDNRPEDKAIGFGLGVTAPADPFGINTASVRFRLSEALTFEPLLMYSTATSTTEVEYGDEKDETVTRSTEIDVGVLVRYRLAQRGRADLDALGGLGLTNTSSETDPEGSKNSTLSDSMLVGLVWGLGADYYLHPHWAISADALNTLFYTGKSSTEDESSEATSTTKTTGLGIGWDPAVRMMIHLYF